VGGLSLSLSFLPFLLLWLLGFVDVKFKWKTN